ncbi:hypothetical protein GOP47_0023252 [Adiantum capillus-veneris]|uniref:Uncharacterized protein n=1 Tax=Adiantum capillus-veneris TaxID=13818 RepID=A0A9D4U754_ADICA|nr:hypothetical protein GOP47_0023252 [Adiantum capillus-veneris]
MAAAIAQATSKRLASLAVSSTPKRMPGVKQLHSSAPKQTGGSHDSHGNGHDSHGDDYDAYLHAEHMYNLPGMKHRKLKMGLAVFAVVAIGTGVPIFAVIFQQKKAMIM